MCGGGEEKKREDKPAPVGLYPMGKAGSRLRVASNSFRSLPGSWLPGVALRRRRLRLARRLPTLGANALQEVPDLILSHQKRQRLVSLAVVLFDL